MGELLFLLLFLVAGIYLFLRTGDFRISKLDTSGGAALFPRIVIVLLCLFIVMRMIQLLCEKDKKPFVLKELWAGSRRFYLLLLLGYVILLKPLGYILATSLFLIALCNGFYLYENHGWGTGRSILCRSILLVCFVLGMNFFFKELLNVFLPAGILSL